MGGAVQLNVEALVSAQLVSEGKPAAWASLQIKRSSLFPSLCLRVPLVSLSSETEGE